MALKYLTIDDIYTFVQPDVLATNLGDGTSQLVFPIPNDSPIYTKIEFFELSAILYLKSILSARIDIVWEIDRYIQTYSASRTIPYNAGERLINENKKIRCAKYPALPYNSNKSYVIDEAMFYKNYIWTCNSDTASSQPSNYQQQQYGVVRNRDLNNLQAFNRSPNKYTISPLINPFLDEIFWQDDDRNTQVIEIICKIFKYKIYTAKQPAQEIPEAVKEDFKNFIDFIDKINKSNLSLYGVPFNQPELNNNTLIFKSDISKNYNFM